MAKRAPDSDILRLIRQSTPATGDDAMTAHELARAMGCGIEKARVTARQLVAAGKLASVQVRRPNVHGIVQPVWAFRVVA